MAHYLIDPEMKHELRYVVAKYLRLELAGVAPDSKAGHLKTALEPEAAARYCEEADLPCACAPAQSDGRAARWAGCWPMWSPLIRVLAEMEFTGESTQTCLPTSPPAERAYPRSGGRGL